MKLEFVFLLGIGLASVGFAAPHRYGSQCGLTDDWGNEALVEFGQSIDAGENVKDEEIAALPTLVKQQLIITAKAMASEAEDAANIDSTLSAVKFLRASSEGGDLDIANFSYQGKRFTRVLFYGGGNPVGIIFTYGSRSPIAEINDSDIICKR